MAKKIKKFLIHPFSKPILLRSAFDSKMPFNPFIFTNNLELIAQEFKAIGFPQYFEFLFSDYLIINQSLPFNKLPIYVSYFNFKRYVHTLLE